MTNIIKTMTIQKRGRKYFDCAIGTHNAKLVINDVSKDFEIGQLVRVEVNDISERSRYGTTLKYEPLQTVSDQDLLERQRVAAEQKRIADLFTWAEGDAMKGLCRTKSIRELLSGRYAGERVDALRVKVEANQKAEEETENQRRIERYNAQAQARKANPRILYAMSQRPVKNVPIRLTHEMGGDGEVVVFESEGKIFIIDENEPSLGNHHLLGYEGSRGCYCYYRPATAAEVAVLEAEEQAARNRRAAVKQRDLRLSAIAAYIKSHGERPAAPCVADGEMLNSSFTLYGGGAAFVVGTDHIWHLTGNGADGDDWSRNNVSGGSIGYRIPIDSAIADELRHLDSHRSDVVQLDVPQFLDEGLDDWPHL